MTHITINISDTVNNMICPCIYIVQDSHILQFHLSRRITEILLHCAEKKAIES